VYYGQTTGSMLAGTQAVVKLLATPLSAVRELQVMKDCLLPMRGDRG